METPLQFSRNLFLFQKNVFKDEQSRRRNSCCTKVIAQKPSDAVSPTSILFRFRRLIKSIGSSSSRAKLCPAQVAAATMAAASQSPMRVGVGVGFFHLGAHQLKTLLIQGIIWFALCRHDHIDASQNLFFSCKNTDQRCVNDIILRQFMR